MIFLGSCHSSCNPLRDLCAHFDEVLLLNVHLTEALKSCLVLLIHSIKYNEIIITFLQGNLFARKSGADVFLYTPIIPTGKFNVQQTF